MQGEVEILLCRLDPDLPVPSRAYPGDAGIDLMTRIDLRLEPGARTLAPTGIAIGLPSGWAGYIHPRSGLAIRLGLAVLNSPGTIDSGYRGELRVPLLNTDPAQPITLARGERIAQLIILPVPQVRFIEVQDLPESTRSDSGFGSSGLAPLIKVGHEAPESRPS